MRMSFILSQSLTNQALGPSYFNMPHMSCGRRKRQKRWLFGGLGNGHGDTAPKAWIELHCVGGVGIDRSRQGSTDPMHGTIVTGVNWG